MFAFQRGWVLATISVRYAIMIGLLIKTLTFMAGLYFSSNFNSWFGQRYAAPELRYAEINKFPVSSQFPERYYEVPKEMIGQLKAFSFVFSPLHDAHPYLLIYRLSTIDEDYFDNFISDISDVFDDFKEATPALSLNVSVNQSGLYIDYYR
jgi:hypothetical protein